MKLKLIEITVQALSVILPILYFWLYLARDREAFIIALLPTLLLAFLFFLGRKYERSE